MGTSEDWQGRIGATYADSEAWWPAPRRARHGAPNVVVLLLDDVGFAQLGCYGSDLDTPTFDRLAADGLRYTNFHTTALCSPTRAALLTGRNHHRNGMGRIIELATGFPGYDAHVPAQNGMLPEVLVPEGYAAYAVGKWHLTPDHETHVAARRDRWPLGKGFERFYGFFGGETHQFAPTLIQDSSPVLAPGGYDDGYHLTADITDRAITYLTDLRNVDPDKPFFLYWAPGACHSPHQVHPEWMEPYRGRFDEGWDVWRERTFARQLQMGLLPARTQLSPRPEHVPAWNDLSEPEQRVYARYMEAFAGMMTHTDAQVGRLVDHLDTVGELDDTLILLLSDNGASSEGGPTGSLNDVRQWNVVPRSWEEALERLDEIGGPKAHNNYPWGWTIAGNTPFKRWKRETHEGGVCDPLVVHWPSGIDPAQRGGIRRQYAHVVDLAPTILDVVGVELPSSIRGIEQSPVDGVSLRPTFADAGAPEVRTTQYFEMFGCRAIYHEDWKAVTHHAFFTDLEDDVWELYHVAEDPSECLDLATEQPGRLERMVQLWWEEAERNQVLPLDDRPLSDLVLDRPTGLPDRARYVYRPGGAVIPESVAADVKNRDHVVTARLTVRPEATPAGTLIAQGSVLGGWVLFLQEGALRYVHNLSGHQQHRIEAPVSLRPGEHELGYRFSKTGEHAGDVELLVDGEVVATGAIAAFTPIRWSLVGHGLSVGADEILSVVEDHPAPFRLNVQLHEVVVEVAGQREIDPEGEAAVAVTTQ